MASCHSHFKPVPIEQGAGWAPELLFTREKSLVPVRNIGVSKCNMQTFHDKKIPVAFSMVYSHVFLDIKANCTISYNFYNKIPTYM